MRERLPESVLLILIATLPFELRFEFLNLSNLQWTFLVLFLAGVPLLIANRNALLQNAVVRAGAVLVLTQWLSAVAATEFRTNAVKEAIRFSAGLVLLLVVLCLPRKELMLQVWTVAAIIAAAYGLADFTGYGVPQWFRNEEFYLGHARRLSGSFEYPNTAAAYYAMSLPVVWSFRHRWIRYVGVFLLWCALVLTFSRGALAAAFLAASLLAAWEFAKQGFDPSALPQSSILALIGIAAYFGLSPFNPLLSGNPLDAKYELDYNMLHQRPNTLDRTQVRVTNTGITKWANSGRRRVGLSYRWYNIETGNFVHLDPIETSLGSNVEPGRTVTLDIPFRTPSDPGMYLLALELYERRLDWFSRTGVHPALIEVHIERAGTRSASREDVSHWNHLGEGDKPALTASAPRRMLWTAALKSWFEHPLLGLGPDNYRLVYGRYLGYEKWDTAIHSNNLYLEFLACSGLIGLAAFLFFLARLSWSSSPACLALGVYLVHGLVDVFVVTTVVYFSFWILAGHVTGPVSDAGRI